MCVGALVTCVVAIMIHVVCVLYVLSLLQMKRMQVRGMHVSSIVHSAYCDRGKYCVACEILVEKMEHPVSLLK